MREVVLYRVEHANWFFCQKISYVLCRLYLKYNFEIYIHIYVYMHEILVKMMLLNFKKSRDEYEIMETELKSNKRF